MRYDEFQASMGRIVALFPFRDDTDQAAYLGVIFEAVARLDAHQFDESVKVVAQAVTPKSRRPVPGAYLEAHRKLSEAKGWFKAGARLESCPECSGTRFHVVYYRVVSTGVPYSGLMPCGRCSPTVGSAMDAKAPAAIEVLTREQYEAEMVEFRNAKRGMTA